MFRALIAALGVSARHNYDMNSLAVPRRAKEVGEGGEGEARGGGGCKRRAEEAGCVAWWQARQATVTSGSL